MRRRGAEWTSCSGRKDVEVLSSKSCSSTVFRDRGCHDFVGMTLYSHSGTQAQVDVQRMLRKKELSREESFSKPQDMRPPSSYSVIISVFVEHLYLSIRFRV